MKRNWLIIMLLFIAVAGNAQENKYSTFLPQKKKLEQNKKKVPKQKNKFSLNH